ncbi:hypothetical protein K491DRAFT_690122 [Lophiostoma macrostomum CBS 122681]|uniref:Uncharacterized protein n=1 Tax=Lophiostoma macrostomum CBS 122681 TaxID=1314788 RepID=A0A6A6TF74_9PLEO|nr:hypothetical protein K491DRAFT_690122 [Lophiostoma macrostomum CBS 122681]
MQAYPRPALEGLATIPDQPNGDGNTGRPQRHSFPRPPSEAHLRDARTPRPTHRSSQTPIRSTSSTSTATVQTSRSASTTRTQGSSPGSRSMSTRSNRSLRHQQHGIGVTKEHLDALAALTAPAPNPAGGMTPESLQFLEQQQRKLDEKIRRQSTASERSARMNLIHEGKKAGNRMSGTGSASASTSASAHAYSTYPMPPSNRTSLSQSHRISMTSAYGPSSSGPGSSEVLSSSIPAEALEGLTPESIRLLREREKLLRWKAARDKVEFERREREKIKERVRRANEMEEARSRELEEKKKGKRRGCCAFLG